MSMLEASVKSRQTSRQKQVEKSETGEKDFLKTMSDIKRQSSRIFDEQAFSLNQENSVKNSGLDLESDYFPDSFDSVFEEMKLDSNYYNAHNTANRILEMVAAFSDGRSETLGKVKEGVSMGFRDIEDTNELPDECYETLEKVADKIDEMIDRGIKGL